MKYLFGAVAALAAITAVSAQDGCADDGGNFYCSLVRAITYTSVGGEGAYNRVTNMDPDTGTCSSSPIGYSGYLSPLNEEVSLHIRGPAILKQFAAYSPGAPSAKKSRRSQHARRHAHGSAHGKRRHAHKQRAVGDTVTATINGLVQTWINEYDGSPAEPTTSAAPPPVESVAPPAEPTDSAATPAEAANSVAPPFGNNRLVSLPSHDEHSHGRVFDSPWKGDDTSSETVRGDGWGRNAYYESRSKKADGLVFLNHMGGQGSGTFDYSFGSSLSYASSDGQGGVPSPEALEDCTIPSRAEVVLMTDEKCEDDSCGYYRPGSVAHHGWVGPRKAFFFEFQMPDDGQSTTNIYDPVNMPAIWMLNAQIPRTLQYGNAECSCWTSGCGEFDIFEVLAPGDTRAKSTLHGNKAGGDSDYFARPLDATIKVGVVMYDDNIHIKILDDDMEFPDLMDDETIDEILGSTLEKSRMVSLFSLAGSVGD